MGQVIQFAPRRTYDDALQDAAFRAWTQEWEEREAYWAKTFEDARKLFASTEGVLDYVAHKYADRQHDPFTVEWAKARNRLLWLFDILANIPEQKRLAFASGGGDVIDDDAAAALYAYGNLLSPAGAA